MALHVGNASHGASCASQGHHFPPSKGSFIVQGGAPKHIRPPPKQLFGMEGEYHYIQTQYGYFVDVDDTWHPISFMGHSQDAAASSAAPLAICDAPGPSMDDNSPASEIISQQLPFMHLSAGGLDSESEAFQGSKKNKQSFKRRTKASVAEEDAPVEEVPLEEAAQSSHVAGDESETDFFGGFEGFNEAKEEEPSAGELRDLEDDEIAQEVGEFCPPGAALYVRANSLRDPPPGLGGMFKDDAGLSHAVYPPILVLARQSFFKPAPSDVPQFDPGFYCLFCKSLRFRGHFGRPFSDFLALSQHLKHSQCVQRPVLAFYRKVLQWNREKVIHKIIEEGLYAGRPPYFQVRKPKAAVSCTIGGRHIPDPIIHPLHTSVGLLDPNAPAWHPFPDLSGKGRAPSKGGYRIQGYPGRDPPRVPFWNELRAQKGQPPYWGCYYC